MSTVVLDLPVIQKIPYKPYSPGAQYCKNGSSQVAVCKQGDIQYGSITCANAPSQPLCSQVDPLVCPTLTGMTSTATVIDSSAAKINCHYTGVMTASTIDDIVEVWPTNNVSYVNVVIPNFCSAPSTNCAPDVQVCTNGNSLGREGEICRKAGYIQQSPAPVTEIAVLTTEPSRYWVWIILFIIFFIFVAVLFFIFRPSTPPQTCGLPKTQTCQYLKGNDGNLYPMKI